MKQRLLEDLKGAMQQKNIIRKNTIQSIRAAILQEEKDKQKELTNSDIENIIVKEKKKRVDALEQFKKANREDLIKQTETEIEILDNYLPKQLTREEIEKEVDTYMKPLSDVSVTQMGSIIKDLKARLGNTADGKTLAEVVRNKILNS